MENKNEEGIILLPFMMPMLLYKELLSIAVSKGKTVPAFVSEAISEKIKREK